MPTKVLIAIPCLLKGGTEFQSLHLVRALKLLHYDVLVVCYFEKDQDIIHTFEEAGAEVLTLNWERGIGAISVVNRLRVLFKDLAPDILHVQYVAPGALPILAGKLAGIKKILATVHQPFTHQSHGPVSKWILQAAARLTDHFIVVSKSAEYSWFGKSQLISEINGSLPQHFTLYNTVQVAQLQKISEEKNLQEIFFERFPQAKGKKLIGTVSRLRYEKGIDLLIQAFAKLKDQFVNTALVLVGDGPDADSLRQLSLDLALEGRVFFWGEADWNQAMQVMALLDIVVVPSRFEGFGLTAAEAKAMGKPLVVADNFGLAEIVHHQLDGLTFQNGSANDLFSCLQWMMENEVESQVMAKKALANAQAYFDWSTFVRNIDRLYTDL